LVIDEFLGSRDGRYFGNGYLRTGQSIDNFKIVDRSDGLDFSCTGHIALPDLWSEKEGDRQRPHLSTIDVIELAVECLRMLLHRTTYSQKLPADFLKKISIVSGNSPVEDGLETLALHGQVRRADADHDVLDLQIANMTVAVTFASSPPGPARYIAFSRQPVSIANVMVNTPEMTACAIVNPANENPDEAWSLSSCFAAALQLGQTLLYKLDGLTRAESNTLWMKRTVIFFSPSPSTLAFPQSIYVRLDGARRYAKPDGEWRRAEIFSLFCNTNIVCSVTHRLPDKALQ
jgi:hypothetical protein